LISNVTTETAMAGRGQAESKSRKTRDRSITKTNGKGDKIDPAAQMKVKMRGKSWIGRDKESEGCKGAKGSKRRRAEERAERGERALVRLAGAARYAIQRIQTRYGAILAALKGGHPRCNCLAQQVLDKISAGATRPRKARPAAPCNLLRIREKAEDEF
jgi:hypothetical protein